MAISFTEENYLKSIYVLGEEGGSKLSNLSIADRLSINPATVTEMLRKLQDKKLIIYDRIKGAKLTKEGRLLALKVIRKHRLWETFLVEKMQFSWDEVHEIAEQLEHIQSDKLIEQLDRLLAFPKFDPHGDPIPDKGGTLPSSKTSRLSQCTVGKRYTLLGVANHTIPFLQFLDKSGLAINDSIEVTDIQEFDKSMHVILNAKTKTIFSLEVANSLLVV